MTLLKYWREALGALLVLAVIAAYGYGHHKGYTEGVSATEVKVAAADAKARSDVASLNAKLSNQAAASVSEVNALRAQIANQPSNQKVVYVEVARQTPGPVEYVPIATPVFIAVGAVNLYNRSLQLNSLPGLLSGAPPGADTGAAGLPSAVSISRYQTVTLENNAACSENTAQLVELIHWVRGVTQ